MSLSQAIQEILATPLGPFLDSDILSDKCQSFKNKMLVLHSLFLECAGQSIGLDESESPPTKKNPPPRTRTHPVRFRGVMTLCSLDWLSERGCQYVEAELKTREAEWRMREGQRRHLDISLESLINGNRNILGWEKIRQSDQQIHVKVLIQGTKSMPAVYLRSKLVPHGLLWSSKDQNRRYSVPTLDAVTLDLSRNYLLRYKLTHIMEEIVRTDAAKTPLPQRTPEYFVGKYLERYAYPDNARRRRLIFTESDPNVDSNGNTRIPRHLRTVHKTEIFSLFASQAEWIYADQCAKPRRVIDIKSWDEFIPTVKKARKNAAREGILWGWPIGGEPQLDEINGETSESDEAEGSDIADHVRIIGKDAATMRRAIRNAKKASSKGKEPMTRALSRSPTPSSGDEPDPLQMHHYDTDFSVSSTEPASMSSSDEDSRYDIDPRIYDKVPLPLFRKPDPPRGDMRWWCPIRDCSYLIDMRNLTEENVGRLRGDIVLHLTNGNWRNFYEDPKVFYGFIDMVNSHYNDHLLKLGLKWTDAVDKERALVWAHPKRRQ